MVPAVPQRPATKRRGRGTETTSRMKEHAQHKKENKKNTKGTSISGLLWNRVNTVLSTTLVSTPKKMRRIRHEPETTTLFCWLSRRRDKWRTHVAHHPNYPEQRKHSHHIPSHLQPRDGILAKRLDRFGGCFCRADHQHSASRSGASWVV